MERMEMEMERMETVWKKTNLHTTIVGGPVVDTAFLHMALSDPDRYKEINELHTRLIDTEAPIMRNSKGELAFNMDGVYYPIQKGRWSVPEEDKDMDDDGKTRVWFDAWKYNAIVEVQGLHFLMYIQTIKKQKAL